MAHVMDPETDPTATWVLEPEEVRRLARHVVTSPGAGQHVAHAPFDGAPIAAVPLSTEADVASAVSRARLAQRLWARRSVAERAAVLLRCHDLVLDRQSEVLDLIQLETGKARTSAYEEVANIALVARHYGRRAARYLAPQRVPGLVPVLTGVTVHRRPVGVVGVISPWNYPLTLSLGDALPALVAGNGVVLKPDLQTSLTALWAADLLLAAGLPEGLVQVVVGDGARIGGALVDQVDHVIFTGSTATGREVAERAGRALVPVSLELGGKNAMYVADDADPAVAAAGAVRSCFSNTGQLCDSIERLLLHESVAEEFLAELVPRVRALRLGAGLDYSADVGSLTSAAQLERVRTHVEDAVSRGAAVLAGGVHRVDVGPLFYEPTLLTDVPDDALVASTETFGPVVSVQLVRDDDHAVEVVNASEFGLSAGVWTRDLARGRRVAARIEAGTVSVNEGYALPWGSTAAPMGGVKSSGIGRRHGVDGIWATTWSQSVAVQRGAYQGLGLGRLYELSGERRAELFSRGLRVVKVLRLP